VVREGASLEFWCEKDALQMFEKMDKIKKNMGIEKKPSGERQRQILEEPKRQVFITDPRLLTSED